MPFFPATCDKVMIDGTTSPDTVTMSSNFNSDEATKALKESGDAFRATTDEPKEVVTLTMSLNSVTPATLVSFYLEVKKVVEVRITLVYKGTPITSEPISVDPNEKVPISTGEIPGSINVDKIIVELTPEDREVEVTGVQAVACFETGTTIIPTNNMN